MVAKSIPTTALLAAVSCSVQEIANEIFNLIIYIKHYILQKINGLSWGEVNFEITKWIEKNFTFHKHLIMIT